MNQPPTSRRPYVVAGSILGAMAGLGFYAWKAGDSGDDDFVPVISIPFVILTGAALGAVSGWIAGGVAGAP